MSAGHFPRGRGGGGGIPKEAGGVLLHLLCVQYCWGGGFERHFSPLCRCWRSLASDIRDAQARSSDSGVCNDPCQRRLLITHLITSNNPTTRSLSILYAAASKKGAAAAAATAAAACDQLGGRDARRAVTVLFCLHYSM